MKFAPYMTVLLLAGVLSGCDSPDPFVPTCGYGAFGGSCGGESAALLIPVVTATNGANPDANGYQLRITRQDCAITAPIAVNETRSVESCGQGMNVVELQDVANNCAVVGSSLRQIEVPTLAGVRAQFVVNCT